MAAIPIALPKNLPTLVASTFATAKKANKLSYFPTEVAILNLNGIPFQLRFSPALANKPVAAPQPPPPTPSTGVTSTSDSQATKGSFDPFANPSKDLYICPVGAAHYLVLNKFAVIPEHFILATTAFEEQTWLLAVEDFEAAWAVIGDWTSDRGERKDLFGFFNSGNHSGASQRHRHLQFLPVEGMTNDVEGGREAWRPLIDSMTAKSNLNLPFSFAAAAIPENPSPKQLHGLYLSLYRRACRTAGIENESFENKTDGKAVISYNMGLTDRAMVICPRRAEGLEIGAESGNGGFIGLNGTVLAGTLLVKNQMEWDMLRSKEGGEKLAKVLEAIGFSTKM